MTNHTRLSAFVISHLEFVILNWSLIGFRG